MLNKLDLASQGAVDPHGDSLTLDGLGNNLEVNTSDDLGLGGNDRLKGEVAAHLQGSDLQSSNSGFMVDLIRGVGLLGPGTDLLLDSTDVGVDTLTLSQSLGLSLGETLGDLSLNTAQVDTTGHPEVTLISPGGVPGVSQKPVVLAALSSPTDQLDAVTTEVLAGGLGVDTIRVEREKGVEVVEDSEASLEGTVVHQLSLVHFQIVAADTRERLEGTSFVDVGPLGARVARTGVALGGGAGARVVGGTAGEALLGTVGVTVVDNPVPGSGGESTVTSLLGALEDGLGGDDGASGGLTVDAETVSERLHGAEVPARTALLLVKDEPATLGPVGTGIERSGDGRPDDKSRQGREKDNLHHDDS